MLAMPQMVDETDVSLTCELLTLLEDVKQPGIVSAFLGRLATGFQFDCAAFCVQPQNGRMPPSNACWDVKTFDIGSPLHPAISRAYNTIHSACFAQGGVVILLTHCVPNSLENNGPVLPLRSV